MHEQDTFIGKIAVIFSGVFAFIARLTVNDAQPYLTAISSFLSCGAAIFAMIYYYKQFHKKNK